MGISGRGIKRITHDQEPHYRPRWSSDGGHVAYQMKSTWYVADSDGTGHTAWDGCSDLTWSTDGKRIAYHYVGSQIAGLYAADADGSNPMLLVRDGAGFSCEEPRWSPKGDRILFSCETHSKGGTRLWLVNSDGSSPRRLASEDVPEGGGTWSPDGSTVLFSRMSTTSDSPTDLFVADQHGVRALNVVPQLRQLGYLGPDGGTWSPDGRRMAICAARGGQLESEVFAVDRDGSRLIDVAPGHHPVWVDNRTLLFVTYDGPGTGVHALTSLRSAKVGRPTVRRRGADRYTEGYETPRAAEVTSKMGFEIGDFDYHRQR